MPVQLEIPSELKASFQRIIRYIPYDLRNDEQIFLSSLAYLCLGGEKLARQGIEVAKEEHKQKINQLKKLRRREAMLNATLESDEENEDENEDEEDDDMDDDKDEFDHDDDLDTSSF